MTQTKTEPTNRPEPASQESFDAVAARARARAIRVSAAWYDAGPPFRLSYEEKAQIGINAQRDDSGEPRPYPGLLKALSAFLASRRQTSAFDFVAEYDRVVETMREHVETERRVTESTCDELIDPRLKLVTDVINATLREQFKNGMSQVKLIDSKDPARAIAARVLAKLDEPAKPTVEEAIETWLIDENTDDSAQALIEYLSSFGFEVVERDGSAE